MCQPRCDVGQCRVSCNLRRSLLPERNCLLFSRFGHALARAFLLVSTASPRTSRRETGPPATSTLKTPTTSRPLYQASASRFVRPSTVLPPSVNWSCPHTTPRPHRPPSPTPL